MDIIALGKAMKAKKEMKQLQDRLGKGVEDIHVDVKTRLAELEKNDPGEVLNKRVSDVESNTHVNINKHNLHMNTVVNKNKFGLTDLVFDDFGDDSGIDASKSTGHSFDSAGHRVKMTDPNTQAEVVTIPETTEVVPQMITVSQATNEKTEDLRSVDLVNGAHIDTVNNGGKVELNAIGTIFSGYTSDIAGLAIKSASSGDASSAFDNGTTTYGWRPNAGELPAWIQCEFTESKAISKIRLWSVYNSGYEAIKDFDIVASNTGSFSGEETTLYTGVHPNDTTDNFVDYEFVNSVGYLYYRIVVNSVYAGNGGNNISIYEIEMMESATQNLYSPTGSYESPVIDLGDNFKSLYKLEDIVTIPEGTSLFFFTASSVDGISFSEYLPLNSDDTIASLSARYVKVKAELTGVGEMTSTLVHDFTESERGDFEADDQILFDGSARLKTSYVDSMTVDTSFSETGILLKTTLDKNQFKTFITMEVK